jgi:hypothetical protein
MNKKIISSLILGALLILLVAPTPAFAVVNSIQTLMVAIVNGVVWVVFCGIAVICFVYAGIMFLSAYGDPGKLQLARSAFLWGVVGVIVGILAYSIILVIERALS